jgi:crotonobetainyl-CoA:carnitine CoA-transferase CaiB-like acyl-CoA transferase
MGGIMGITGPDADSPTKTGPGVGDMVPALMLAIGILAAVHHAKRTGEGQFVDVAMTDAVLALCERIIYQKSYTHVAPKPEGNRHPLLSPFGLFRAKDGWVSIAVAHDGFWIKLANAIGRPELAEDPCFVTTLARVENGDEVIDIVEAFTRKRTKAEIAECLGGIVPFGPVYTADDIFKDPHYRVREMIVDLEYPGLSELVQVAGVPIKLSMTPGAVRHRAPLLGEQTDDILAAVGYGADAVRNLRALGVVR